MVECKHYWPRPYATFVRHSSDYTLTIDVCSVCGAVRTKMKRGRARQVVTLVEHKEADRG